jgi:hypothetical protein
MPSLAHRLEKNAWSLKSLVGMGHLFLEQPRWPRGQRGLFHEAWITSSYQEIDLVNPLVYDACKWHERCDRVVAANSMSGKEWGA